MKSCITLFILISSFFNCFTQEFIKSINKVDSQNTYLIGSDFPKEIIGIIKMPNSSNFVFANGYGELISYNKDLNTYKIINQYNDYIHDIKLLDGTKSFVSIGGHTIKEINQETFYEEKVYIDTTMYFLSFCWIKEKQLYVLGTDNNGIVIFDVSNKMKIIKNIKNEERVWAIDYDTVNRVIIAGLSNGDILLINPYDKYSTIKIKGHESDITCVKAIPNNKYITLDATEVKIWNVDGSLFKNFTDTICEGFQSFVLNNDSESVIIVGFVNTIMIWNFLDNKLLYSNVLPNENNISIKTSKITYKPENQCIKNGYIKAVCLTNGNENTILSGINPIRITSVNKCNNIGVLDDNNNISVCEVQTGNIIKKAKRPKKYELFYTSALSLSNDCNLLYFGDSVGRLFVWDIGKNKDPESILLLGKLDKNGKVASAYRDYSTKFNGLLFYASEISVGYIDQRIRINNKDISKKEKVFFKKMKRNFLEFKNFSIALINSIDINKEHSFVAVGTNEGILRVFYLYENSNMIKESKYDYAITNVRFSNNNKYLSICLRNGEIRILECLNNFKEIRKLNTQSYYDNKLLFTNKDDTLIIFNNNEIKLIDFRNGKEIKKFVSPENYVISDVNYYNNNLLVAFCDKNKYYEYQGLLKTSVNTIEKKTEVYLGNNMCVYVDENDYIYIGNDYGIIYIYDFFKQK